MGNLQTNANEIAAGLAEAAAELGSLRTIYRSTDYAASPLLPANIVGTLLASFPRNYTYRLPLDPTKPQRQGVLDSRLVQVGDYLVDDTETYFVSNVEPLLPVLCIACNNVVLLYSQSTLPKAGAVAPVGDVGRLGNVANGPRVNAKQLLAGWPASVLYSGRGSKTLSGLPTDDTSAQWTMLLPKLPFTLNAGDLAQDAAGRRYTILAGEESPTGTRIITNQAVE